MEEEEVLKLIDSYWFSREIFKKSSKKVSSSTCEEIPSDEKVYENRSSSKTEILSQSLIETRRSMSSETSSNDVFFSESVSPDSVVLVCNKETAADDDEKKKKKTKKGLSKSLSELEFEEVKGFMDLGFVFSEEDKDSSLVEIIPGLQRRRRMLGKEIKEEEEQQGWSSSSSSVARPYLSEAWEVLEMRKTKKKKKKNPLINWKVPNSSNEIDIKDSLKCIITSQAKLSVYRACLGAAMELQRKLPNKF